MAVQIPVCLTHSCSKRMLNGLWHCVHCQGNDPPNPGREAIPGVATPVGKPTTFKRHKK
jgi:hypothetical protein